MKPYRNFTEKLYAGRTMALHAVNGLLHASSAPLPEKRASSSEMKTRVSPTAGALKKDVPRLCLESNTGPQLEGSESAKSSQGHNGIMTENSPSRVPTYTLPGSKYNWRPEEPSNTASGLKRAWSGVSSSLKTLQHA
jgi:hypothetical protein